MKKDFKDVERDAKKNYETETASENEYLNGQSKINKPKRNDKNQYR